MWVIGREQAINVYRNLEGANFNPGELLLGIQDFSGESKYRCGKITRELELQEEPEDVTELLQSHDKT